MDILISILKKLTTENQKVTLSDLMIEGLVYAEEKKLDAFKEWIREELYGRQDGTWFVHPNQHQSKRPYRYTKFEARQAFGLNLRFFFNIPTETLLVAGIIEIEKSIRYGNPIEYTFSEAEHFKNAKGQTWSDFVHKSRFYPKDLEVTLDKIRIEYISKINDIIRENNKDEGGDSQGILEKIKNLIINDEIEDALLLISKNNPEIENDTILFLSRLSSVRKQLIRNTIKQDDYQLELSKIKSGVLQMLNTMSDI
ncbi:MAG: hypothetical protein LCH81_15485 [Bacteroidetes bacterium]|nr:hypothetical protein [Bacteroidota bacterium]